MESIKTLMDKARQKSLSSEKVESAYMDLIESLIRHLAIVAIVAYRSHGCRNKKINGEISKQLPLPTMGSWKNILQLLGTTDKSLFPDKFHDAFLSILTRKTKDAEICKAYCRIGQLLEFVTTEKNEFKFTGKEEVCSVIQFIERMVTYRNRFTGHGTSSMPQYLVDSVEVILSGIITLCRYLQKIWRSYPIYISSKGNNMAGGTYHRLTSLLSFEDDVIEIKDANIKENQLYICLDKKNRGFASLFPLAVWHADDVMFFNGTKDFKKLLYIGYNALESVFGTDKLARDFCEFYLSFNGFTLEPVDLFDEPSWGKVSQSLSADWKSPRLREGVVLGLYSHKSCRLKKRISRNRNFDIWKAESGSGDKVLTIKFIHNCDCLERLRCEALVLKALSTRSRDVVKIYDFLFDPYPTLQVPYLVMDYVGMVSLKDLAQGKLVFTSEEVLTWLEKALQALAPFHENGIVLRNIAPENLVFTEDKKLKIMDAGLAGFTAQDNPELCTIMDSQALLDPADFFQFASPELLQTGEVGKEVTSKADIFSLGASLYFVLTGGNFPYGSEDPIAVSKNHLKADIIFGDDSFKVTPILEFNQEYPAFLNDIILRMLDVEVDYRPDAEMILSEIGEFREEKEERKGNVSCKLMGSIKDLGIDFKGLMPNWLNMYFFKIWPLSLFVIFFLAISICYKLDILHSVSRESINLCFPGVPENFKAQPLLHDTTFFAWLIMSMSFIVLLLRLVKSVQGVMQEIFHLTYREKDHWLNAKKRNDFWAKIIKSYWVMGITSIAAILMCSGTYIKMFESLIKGHSYWSDWRFSNWTFFIKEYLNVVNCIGVTYLLFFLIAIIDIFSLILRGLNPEIDLYEKDYHDGLNCIGRLQDLFLPSFLILSYGLSLILVVEFGNNTTLTVVHLAGIVICTMLYFFFIIWPVMPIRKYIIRYRDMEAGLINKRRNRVEKKRKKYLQMPGDFNFDHTKELLALNDLQNSLLNSEKVVRKLYTWPLNKTRLIALFISGFIPIIFALTFIYKHTSDFLRIFNL